MIMTSSEQNMEPVNKKNGKLVMIERDTIQTRNLVPVINHAALIVNPGSEPLRVSIESPLSMPQYSENSPLAAFGEDSLLGAPMFAPFAVPYEKCLVLEKPELRKVEQGFAYAWKDVPIAAKQAAMAQYDNYFGPIGRFFRPDGLEFSGLKLIEEYTIQRKGAEYDLHFTIILKNTGGQDIDEAFFRLFLPTALVMEGEPPYQPLIEVDEIWGGEKIGVDTSTMVDGTGRTAKGIDASIPIGRIPRGQEYRFVLQLKMKIVTDNFLLPLLTILGRSPGNRCWPPTRLPDPAVQPEKRFNYLFYNLVIGDRFAIELKSGNARIVHVETLPAFRELQGNAR